MALRFSPGRGAAALVLNSMVRGPIGAAATIEVGSVSPLTPGTTPTVTNVGSTAAAVFNFGIPTSKTVSVGTTTTGAEGTSAAVSDSGDADGSIFDFTIPRGASPAIGYTFSTTTTDSDPGNGVVRFNNATPASITAIYFDNQDADGISQTAWLDTFDDSTNTSHKGYLTFTDVTAPSTKIVVNVTGSSVVDGTGYRKVTVTHKSGTTLFTNSRRLAVVFSMTGDKGADGAGDLTAANNLSDVANAATAFANIKQAATATATGVVELATDAETQTGTDTARAITPSNLTAKEATTSEYRGNTADRILTTDQVWSAAGLVALTDGANISLNLASGINFSVTLGGNRTLDNPTNAKVGQTGIIVVTQDATGSRTLSYGTSYKFAGATAPTLTTTASRVDYLVYWVETSTRIWISANKDIR